MGEGPARLADNSLNPDAVGVFVTGGTVGVVKYANGTYAVFAFGRASFLGLDGLTIKGTIAVRINTAGTAIDQTITLPTLPTAADPATDGMDNNGNGRIDAGDLLNDIRWENGLDEDRNGFRDDLIGWDFANNDADPFDDNGHGTHTSGTIGALNLEAAAAASTTIRRPVHWGPTDRRCCHPSTSWCRQRAERRYAMRQQKSR